MGFHLCEWCFGDHAVQIKCAFSNMSSGDVTLVFDTGHAYVVPDMILHYVHDHGWQPPEAFIDDVMKSNLVGGGRIQTKSLDEPSRVGYLSGSFVAGPVPEGFVLKLQSLMREAENSGGRTQYRSFKPGVLSAKG